MLSLSQSAVDGWLLLFVQNVTFTAYFLLIMEDSVIEGDSYCMIMEMLMLILSVSILRA